VKYILAYLQYDYVNKQEGVLGHKKDFYKILDTLLP